jgi:hypothetical protein
MNGARCWPGEVAAGSLYVPTVCGVGSTKTKEKRVEANEIRAALDSTVASLLGGVQRLGIEAALPVIDGWEGRLTACGDPELAPVAENLVAFRASSRLVTSTRLPSDGSSWTLGIKSSGWPTRTSRSKWPTSRRS